MEIELYSKMQDPLDAISRIGKFFAKSGMFGCDREEQGLVLAMVCLAEKKSPIEITRVYHIVEGKLSKKALAALAEFRASGGKHKWISTGDESTDNPDHRVAKLHLTDKDGNLVEYSYSIADAKAEGLLRNGSRWTKRPGNMLRARCISNGLGMLCPEIYAGDDGDQDNEPQSAPVINLAPAIEVSAQVKPEPKAAIVTEVKTEDEKAEAAMGLAPAIDVETVAAKLPDDLVTQVENAIGAKAIAAVNWMIANGWLKKGQGLDSLTEGKARRIIKQRDGFLRAVDAAEGGAK